MTKPELTIDPIPPTAGDSVTVTYTGPLPGSITVTFDPSSDKPLKLTLDENGQVTVPIPVDAETMKVTDDAGLADAESTHVDP